MISSMKKLRLNILWLKKDTEKRTQAPFAPAIARCYLTILLIEYDLSQKFDLEAIAI